MGSPPAVSLELLAQCEDPQDSALWNMDLRRRHEVKGFCLHLVCINAPPRLNRHILDTLYGVGAGYAYNAGIGPLFPKNFARPGVESSKISVIGASHEYQSTSGGEHWAP